MTIFLSLVMVFFLSFCIVLLEGVRMYDLRVEAEQAMELAEFSVLSEYQYELFAHYGVFFLDLDYEQGKEYPAILESRVKKYLTENAPELESQEIIAENLVRATDGGGSAFLKQAVEMMKVQSGYKVFEELLPHVEGQSQDTQDLEVTLEENETEAEEILGGFIDENGLPLFDISLPDISFPTIETLRTAILGDSDGLSEKAVSLEERLEKRSLEKGVGAEEKIGTVQMQWFHGYLFEYFGFYGSTKEGIWKESLEYQLEYMISGEAEDIKNLENVMWRIFLLRAGGDYLFYHQDPLKLAEAQAEAIAIAGVSANAALIKAVKEIILVSKAIDAAIEETKDIFAGEKVPLYQQGVFAGVELGYEEYLYLCLNMTSKTEKIYRCMDLIEMEVREKSGYEDFRLDHCTDEFQITWRYQYDGLLLKLPWGIGNRYEEVMMRKFYYEK